MRTHHQTCSKKAKGGTLTSTGSRGGLFMLPNSRPTTLENFAQLGEA